MKLIASRTELAAAVAWTSRAVNRNASSPAMSGLLVQVSEEGVLGLIGYNGHQMHAHRVELCSDGGGWTAGECLIPAAILGFLLNAASAKDVLFQIDDQDGLGYFSSGRLKSTIPLLRRTEYPSRPPASHSGTAPRLPASELADMVRRASYAVQDNNPDPLLTGLRLEADGERLHVVGVQHSYCSLVSTPMLGSSTLEVVVPATFLEQATMDVGDGEVSLSLADDLLTVTSERRVSVLSALVSDKPFPPWRKLQRPPTDGAPDDLKIVLNAPELAKRLRALMPLADSWGRVRFTFEANQIELAVRSGMGGGSITTDVIEGIGQDVSAVPIVRTVRGLFLAQTLGALKTEKVVLHLPPDKGRAMTLRADDEHIEHDVLLMPNRKEIGDD